MKRFDSFLSLVFWRILIMLTSITDIFKEWMLKVRMQLFLEGAKLWYKAKGLIPNVSL